MKSRRATARALSILVCCFMVFQLTPVSLCRANAPTSETPLKLDRNHYDIRMDGVRLYRFLNVSLPYRTIKISSTDLAVIGNGYPLTVERVYTGISSPKGLLGPGWALGNIERVDVLSKKAISTVNAYRSSIYRLVEEDRFVNRDLSVIALAKNGNFSRKSRNGEMARFSKDGNLLYKEDSNGNRLTYEYKNRKLVRMIESCGRNLFYSYHPDGLLKSVKDDAERTVSFGYNASGQLTAVNRFGLQKTLFRYTEDSRLTGIVPPNGIALTITYDEQNPSAVKKIKSSRGEWVAFEPLKSGIGIKVSDHTGNSFIYEYAYSGNKTITTISNDAGWSTEYQVDKKGNLVSWKKPDGNRMNFKYDALNRLIHASDSSGCAMTRTYKGMTHLPVETKDRRGRKTVYAYDKRQNVIAVTPPGQETISFERFLNGMIKQQKQGNLILSTTAVDKQGNPVMTRTGSQAENTFSYDALGRLIKEISGEGTTYEYRYNEFDQLTQFFRNGKKLVEYTYSPTGRLKTARDMKGRTFEYAFDKFGYLKTVTTPRGAAFAIQRSQEPYTITRRFPNLVTRVSKRDYAGRVTGVTDPFGNEKIIKRTPSFSLDSIIDADGNSVKYTYHRNGTVIEKLYSNGEIHVIRYANGRIVSLQSPSFHQEYKYNEQGKLSAFRDKNSNIIVRYQHDRMGRPTSISVNRGIGTIKYAYDENNRISSITDPGSRTTRYTYDDSGRVQEILFPNSVRQRFTYDNKLDSVNSIAVESGKSDLFKELYLYDEDGLVLETRDALENTVLLYTYNEECELMGCKQKSGRSVTAESTFSYDANGNITEETHNDQKTRYEYVGIGRLTKHGNKAVRHDKRGNLVAASLPGGEYKFEYDMDNRLQKAEAPGRPPIEFRYDPIGRLVYCRKGKEERHILWSGNRRLLELDGAKKLVKFYVHGRGLDEIISIKKDKTYCFHQDRLGSVRLVTDEKGQVVAKHDYDPFGTPRMRGESTAGLEDAVIFAGHPYDPDIGCYYLRARFYHPVLKRFLTRDSVVGLPTMPLTWNPYVYAMNNPVNFSDPQGELVLAAVGSVNLYGGAAVISSATDAAGTAAVAAHDKTTALASDPGMYMSEAVENKVNSAQEAVETATGTEISYKEGDEDDPTSYEDVQTRVEDTEKTVETVASPTPFETEVVNQTNPNDAERVKQNKEDVANYINDEIKEAQGPVTDAVTKELPGGESTETTSSEKTGDSPSSEDKTTEPESAEDDKVGKTGFTDEEKDQLAKTIAIKSLLLALDGTNPDLFEKPETDEEDPEEDNNWDERDEDSDIRMKTGEEIAIQLIMTLLEADDEKPSSESEEEDEPWRLTDKEKEKLAEAIAIETIMDALSDDDDDDDDQGMVDKIMEDAEKEVEREKKEKEEDEEVAEVDPIKLILDALGDGEEDAEEDKPGDLAKAEPTLG
ncbi:RHS repeat-associated core domain-containing protein, partial [Verrucomicrobiota bacterium]